MLISCRHAYFNACRKTLAVYLVVLKKNNFTIKKKTIESSPNMCYIIFLYTIHCGLLVNLHKILIFLNYSVYLDKAIWQSRVWL